MAWTLSDFNKYILKNWSHIINFMIEVAGWWKFKQEPHMDTVTGMDMPVININTEYCNPLV